MKRLTLLCAATVLLAGVARAEEDRGVVSVNGTVIRQSEIVERLWKRYGPATLDDIIDELLLRQAAQAQGLKADRAEVERRLERLRAQFSDPALFENELKQSGRSVAQLKSEISDQVIVRQFLSGALKISISEGDLEKAFRERRDQLAVPPAVRLRHILVKTQADADEVVTRLRDGTDFGALARQRSLAATGRLNGGDYGFVSRGMLPEEIERVAFDMKAGEVRVVPSAKGFHILQVTDQRPSQPARYEAAKDELRDLLLAEKMKSALPAYLRELRRRADIQPLGSAR